MEYLLKFPRSLKFFLLPVYQRFTNEFIAHFIVCGEIRKGIG
jgi:hypothetical protein